MGIRWLQRATSIVLPGLLAACGGLSQPGQAPLSYPSVSHQLLVAQSCSSTPAKLGHASSIAVDHAGNVYVADTESNFQHVDKLTPDGKLTVFAGNGRNNGDTYRASEEGRPATSVEVMAQGLTVDSAGNLYIASPYGRVFRVGTDGRIHLVAGRGATFKYSGDGGPATQGDLNRPSGLVTDPAGNVYVSDTSNFRVRRVGPDGRITTIAGNGTQGSHGDGGLATAAQLNLPDGLALDVAGNLYIADNTAVRKVTRDGMITTVAGDFANANVGFGGDATKAALLTVRGIALDRQGNLYIASASIQDGSSLADQDGGLFVVTPDGILHKIIAATSGSTSNGIVDVTADPDGNIYYAAQCGVYRLESS